MIQRQWVHQLTLGLVLTMALNLVAFSAAGADVPQRQKVIDFEDEVVEGMNKRPLDSLSQISERDRKRRKTHLYRKRGGFRTEIARTHSELRFLSHEGNR